MPEIVTDHEVLCKKSEPINDLEIGDVVQRLSVSIPDHALGLAAPQIGVHKRVFLANLSSGSYAFINPKIIWTSSDRVPSEESCLSLSGISRCVERHSQVTVSCYKLINMKTGDLVVDPDPMRLKDRDSFIVQHEHDHLNGILITALPVTLSWAARKQAKDKKKKERTEKARAEKNKIIPLPKSHKLSSKNLAKKNRAAEKAKNQSRTARRQEKIRVEIQERFKAEQEGLFEQPNTSPEVTENNE